MDERLAVIAVTAGAMYAVSILCAAYALWAVRGVRPRLSDVLRVSFGYDPQPRLAQMDRAQGSEP